MKNTKAGEHASGEWKYLKRLHYNESDIPFEIFVEPPPNPAISRETLWIKYPSKENTLKELGANAKLKEANTDMLKALEKCISTIGTLTMISGITDKTGAKELAKAAIRKAKGL